MMKKYNLAKPYITNKEKKYVADVLDSGYLSLGPKYREFEQKFAKKIGARYACAVSSGTAGLHLAMLACRIKPGDEVITSPFSFIASANCILYVGAKPVFVDIDPKTYNIDPSKIEEKITKKTKAIMVVHIFGQPARMDPIMKLARKYKLHVIEDACESICAAYKDHAVGTFGKVSVFSFYPNKQMTTGEGGMLVTNDKRIYTECSSLRNQGRADDTRWLDHKNLGYNYRMTEMSAALGLAQLEKLDFLIKQKQMLARSYHHYLDPFSDIIQLPDTAKTNTHTWFLYVIKIKNKKINRDAIIRILRAQGIATKAYFPSIHLFSFYKKKFGYTKGDFPISEALSASSLALPFYIGLKKNDIAYISQKVAKTIKLYGERIQK